ncbi:MAG: hypothetical protein NVV70_07795 [Cellulomonas sp.]|nr:hypothetical protein [Cellulomonas sp.]MCR6648030.1 hypothetical protein [Cellulomonas sp.]
MSEAGFDRAILEDYAVIARRRGPAALARTAMRTRSRALRELLAYVASEGELDYRALADGQEPSDWRYIWLGALARTVALQELDDDDATVAVALLRRTLKKAPRERKPAYVDLLAALLFDAGDYAGARTRWRRTRCPRATHAPCGPTSPTRTSVRPSPTSTPGASSSTATSPKARSPLRPSAPAPRRRSTA